MFTESADAKLPSSETVIVVRSFICSVFGSTSRSLALEDRAQRAEGRAIIKTRPQSLAAICHLPSAIRFTDSPSVLRAPRSDSPPYPPVSRRLRLHPPQFLLLLLLHAAKQCFQIQLPLRLLSAGARRRFLLLLVLAGFVLLIAGRRRLRCGFARERDLEIALRAGVIGAELERFDEVVDRVIERLRCERAVAEVERVARSGRELVGALERFHGFAVLLLVVRVLAARAGRMRVCLGEPLDADGEEQRDHSAPRLASEPPRKRKKARASGH